MSEWDRRLDEVRADERDRVATKPDWGHGPNSPVRMFTVEQLREVMEDHHCYATLDVGRREINMCVCTPIDAPPILYDTNHFIEKLKEAYP